MTAPELLPGDRTWPPETEVPVTSTSVTPETTKAEQDEVLYLLWSNKHEAWWKPGAWGYTNVQSEAGRFTEAEATRYVVASAQCGRLAAVTCMVAAPDNWGVTS